MRYLAGLFMASSLVILAGSAAYAVEKADIAIVGATPSGIAAAVAAKRAGAVSVMVLEPSGHIGGRFAEALGFDEQDRMNPSSLGGLWSEWRGKINAYYGGKNVLYPEPHVQERLFEQWLAAEGVKVQRGFQLVRMEKNGRRIVLLRAADGREVDAKIVIDGTYLGDLLPLADIANIVGRESRAQYGESLAGVLLNLISPPGKVVEPIHRSPVSGFAEDGKSLLPHVQGLTTDVVEGAGDAHLQCFNLSACLTWRATNRIELTEPKDYDPREFELLRRDLKRPGSKAPIGFGGIVNDKAKVNDAVPVLVHWGLVGGGDAYPLASAEQRRGIWEAHRAYTHRLLWFLQTDLAVPEAARKNMLRWGLPQDEFAANSHWPWDLYAREGRRMLGEFVMTQRDLFDEVKKLDAVALGSFPVDSHAVQRLAAPGGSEVVNEGGYLVETPVYQIPYRALLPRRTECENLLVPVALSCSRVAYNSLRVEPTWMATGEAAGVAAMLAAADSVSVHDVSIQKLQYQLRKASLPIDLP